MGIDLQESSEHNTESSYISFLLSPMTRLLYYQHLTCIINLCQFIKQYSYIIIKPNSYSDFLKLYQIHFLSQHPIRLTYCILSLCLLKVLLAVTVSQTYLPFDDPDNFENCCRVLCRMAINWDWSVVFLMITLAIMGFGEEDHISKMLFSLL